MFKDKFKYYKKKVPEPSLQSVLDVKAGDKEFVTQFPLRGIHSSNIDNFQDFGLVDPSTWKVFELNHHPGLIFIVNPFTNHGQRYWIARSVADYSAKPNVTNLTHQKINVYDDSLDKSWWDLACCELTYDKNSISRKMRWATMGYHHNWDTKVYSEEAKGPFPDDLKRLSEFIVKVIFNTDFKPEAAIVNFYLMDSFLSGHVDRSEVNTSAPLVSLSFGQTAIFLIGGETIAVDPDAIFLESGDIIMMTGASRLHYHGVPRIIRSRTEFWNDFSNCERNTLEAEGNESNEKIDFVTRRKVDCKYYWEPFARYISQARVNLNVRQVNFFDNESGTIVL